MSADETMAEVLPTKRTPREACLYLADFAERLANTLGIEDTENRPTAKEAAIELDGLSMAMIMLADRLDGPDFQSTLVLALDALLPGSGPGGTATDRIATAREIIVEGLTHGER